MFAGGAGCAHATRAVTETNATSATTAAMRAEAVLAADHERCPCGIMALRQRLDRGAVRPRKTFGCRFVPGQPRISHMLSRVERNGHGCGDCEPEHVLGVVGRARRIAMPPLRKYFVHVGQIPISHARREARASMPVSSRSSRMAVAGSDSPGSWLPVTDCQMIGKIGALDEQHVAIRRCKRGPAPKRVACTSSAAASACGDGQATNVQNADVPFLPEFAGFRRTGPRASPSPSGAPRDRRLRAQAAMHATALLPSQSRSSRTSASASQLWPKCSGSLSARSSSAKSVARSCAWARSATANLRWRVRRRGLERVGARRSTDARRHRRHWQDRAPSFADPLERADSGRWCRSTQRASWTDPADDPPRAAGRGPRRAARCTRDNSPGLVRQKVLAVAEHDAVAVVGETARPCGSRARTSRRFPGQVGDGDFRQRIRRRPCERRRRDKTTPPPARKPAEAFRMRRRNSCAPSVRAKILSLSFRRSPSAGP